MDANFTLGDFVTLLLRAKSRPQHLMLCDHQPKRSSLPFGPSATPAVPELYSSIPRTIPLKFQDVFQTMRANVMSTVLTTEPVKKTTLKRPVKLVKKQVQTTFYKAPSCMTEFRTPTDMPHEFEFDEFPSFSPFTNEFEELMQKIRPATPTFLDRQKIAFSFARTTKIVDEPSNIFYKAPECISGLPVANKVSLRDVENVVALCASITNTNCFSMPMQMNEQSIVKPLFLLDKPRDMQICIEETIPIVPLFNEFRNVPDVVNNPLFQIQPLFFEAAQLPDVFREQPQVRPLLSEFSLVVKETSKIQPIFSEPEVANLVDIVNNRLMLVEPLFWKINLPDVIKEKSNLKSLFADLQLPDIVKMNIAPIFSELSSAKNQQIQRFNMKQNIFADMLMQNPLKRKWDNLVQNDSMFGEPPFPVYQPMVSVSESEPEEECETEEKEENSCNILKERSLLDDWDVDFETDWSFLKRSNVEIEDVTDDVELEDMGWTLEDGVLEIDSEIYEWVEKVWSIEDVVMEVDSEIYEWAEQGWTLEEAVLAVDTEIYEWVDTNDW